MCLVNGGVKEWTARGQSGEKPPNLLFCCSSRPLSLQSMPSTRHLINGSTNQFQWDPHMRLVVVKSTPRTILPFRNYPGWVAISIYIRDFSFDQMYKEFMDHQLLWLIGKLSTSEEEGWQLRGDRIKRMLKRCFEYFLIGFVPSE